MSKPSVLGIGFVLLVVGFVLGHAVAPSPSEPAAVEIPAESAPERQPTRLFVPPETRDTVLEILRNAVREPDSFARITRLAALLPSLGAEIVPEIRAILDDKSLDPGVPGIDLMLRWWVRTDPAGAALWALLRNEPGIKSVAVQATMEAWAEADPIAAAQHLQSISRLPTQSTKAAEIALVRGWFHSGTPGLTEYIQGLGLTVERQRAIRSFARATIQRDGSAAIIGWADAIPGDDAKFKLDVNRQVAVEVTRADPPAAVAWCERVCDGPSATNMRAMIAENWALSEGQSTMEWVATSPAGKERDWAAKAAFRGWIRGNHEEFFAWVNAIGIEGVEPWFQPNLEYLAINLSHTKPTEAVQWAAAITDEVDRVRTYVTVARNWRAQDPAAADAWIAQMGFSESVRERMLAPPRKVRRQGAASAENVLSDADSADGVASDAAPAETAPDPSAE